MKLYFLNIFFIGLVLGACKMDDKKPDNPNLDSIEIRPEVVFTTVNDEPLRFFIESRGIVEPMRRVQIIPRVSGFIKNHLITTGKWVEEGEVILQFKDDEWKNAEKQAYNNYLKAKNAYTIESQLRSLGTGDNKTSDELVRITTGLAEAELNYESAKLMLSYATIEAPFSGYISTDKVISNGAYVSAGQELGMLIDDNKVRIRFEVLESEIDALEKGMLVQVTDPSNNTFSGEITAIAPVVDPETKTGQILVEVDNMEGKLKSGMTVEGRIFVKSQRSKVKMPREALLERDGRTLVFKLNGNEVQWIYVTPEAMNTDWVLVNHSDIEPGDTLAIDQHFSISHQQKVVPLMAN